MRNVSFFLTCICLPVYLSAYRSVCQSVHLCASVRVSICLSVRPSVCLSDCCQSIRPCTCVHPSLCLSNCLSVRPYAISVCPSVHLSVCPSVHMCVRASVRPYFYLSLSVCLSVCLSVYIKSIVTVVDVVLHFQLLKCILKKRR